MFRMILSCLAATVFVATLTLATAAEARTTPSGAITFDKRIDRASP